MRRLFFIICCFLALDICLAGDWWKDNFIIGAHWGPPLHHKNNNVDSPLVRNFTLLKDGGFNYILGKMNSHNYIANSFLENNLDYLVGECKDTCDNNNMFFLNDTADLHNLSDPTLIEFGLNIKDEPSLKDSTLFLTKVQNLKQNHPDLLGFVNLLPIHFFRDEYGEIDYDSFTLYLDSYLGDTTLQVACFDNYNPHSNFSSDPSSSRGNYYVNLADMKNAAGSRPMWAYLRSSEKFLEEKESPWQDAYIRLVAFAPLAFGAKGIIYFSYDCKDRNMILRSPGGGAWGKDIFFDNDEKSRQIFFGNVKRDSTSQYPDLLIHTNDDRGTWRILETDSITVSQDMTVIGTWFGDHYHNMPNIYNWDFSPDGFDKFTTITSGGALLLSKFRSGWIKKAIIDNFPTPYWSTMSRYTCPFGDFNVNKALDLCLGWKESGRGKLRICMDCQNVPTTTQGANMAFSNTSQIFTFCDPIKQVIASRDSFLYVITSNPDSTYIHSDSIYTFKYSSNQFNAVDTSLITLQNRIDHYWMEDSLYAQDIDGKVWGEAPGLTYSLTKYIKNFSSNLISVWGQYNSRTNKYDRYGLAADGRSDFQSYALLDRKGNPNRIYYTAQAVNQFINDSIITAIKNSDWKGAYFTSEPNQSVSNSLEIIEQEGSNPLPLIYNYIALPENVLFGLFRKRLSEDLDLLVINMQENPQDIVLTFDLQAQLPRIGPYTYECEKITRMNPSVNLIMNRPIGYTSIRLNNMLGGECAIIHFKRQHVLIW